MAPGGGPVAGRRAAGLLINNSNPFTGFSDSLFERRMHFRKNALSGDPGDSASPPCFFTTNCSEYGISASEASAENQPQAGNKQSFLLLLFSRL